MYQYHAGFYHYRPVKVAAILLICFAGLFASCSSTDPSKKAGKKNAPVDIIELPPTQKMRPADSLNLAQQCRNWYDTILANTNFNGGILVAKGGQIIFEKYKGAERIGGKDSINQNTPFHIASVSKTFTGMAVLLLWQNGKLQLEDELAVYFPGFPYPGVTVRSLLNHRSGIPNYLYFMDEKHWDKNKIIRNQDILDYLINQKQSIQNIAPPNTRFSYCNTNYALLALLIEKVSGKSYPEFMKETFFDPLQMTNSFVYTSSDSGRITQSYDWRGQLIPMNNQDVVYGDKNIYSTCRDLLQWDQLLATDLLFKPATFEQAYTPYSNEKPGIRNYGLGWRMNVYPDGNKIIFHNGWWHGNNASFIRLIKEGATIIAVGNRFNRGIYKAKYLVNIFGPDYYTAEEEENENPKPADTATSKQVKEKKPPSTTGKSNKKLRKK